MVCSHLRTSEGVSRPGRRARTNPIAERKLSEMKSESPTRIQDEFLEECMETKAKVDIVTLNGYHLHCTIIGTDDITISVLGDKAQRDVSEKRCLVYKHTISTIVPL